MSVEFFEWLIEETFKKTETYKKRKEKEKDESKMVGETDG